MDSNKIAHIMSDASHKIVWPAIKEISKNHNKKVDFPFDSRVGTGRRTYHIIKKHKGRHHHVVTYGKKMIEDKKDYNVACLWLTGREISEKGYFKGQITYINLIAHTVLHEMAHALQTIMGDRTYNSVHNKAFYQWLDLLHKKCGQEVIEKIQSDAKKHKISLEFKETKQREKVVHQKTDNIRVDAVYEFYYQGQPTLVKIRKINPKRVVGLIVEKGHANFGDTLHIPKHLIKDAPESQDIVKSRLNLNAEKNQNIDISRIKVFGKYSIVLKKQTMTVEVKRKNKSTAIVEILKGHKDMIGQRWKVPLTVLQSA